MDSFPSALPLQALHHAIQPPLAEWDARSVPGLMPVGEYDLNPGAIAGPEDCPAWLKSMYNWCKHANIEPLHRSETTTVYKVEAEGEGLPQMALRVSSGHPTAPGWSDDAWSHDESMELVGHIGLKCRTPKTYASCWVDDGDKKIFLNAQELFTASLMDVFAEAQAAFDLNGKTDNVHFDSVVAGTIQTLSCLADNRFINTRVHPKRLVVREEGDVAVIGLAPEHVTPGGDDTDHMLLWMALQVELISLSEYSDRGAYLPKLFRYAAGAKRLCLKGSGVGLQMDTPEPYMKSILATPKLYQETIAQWGPNEAAYLERIQTLRLAIG